jgi:BolA family transcriptional regulator, general stress-responsive regulator
MQLENPRAFIEHCLQAMLAPLYFELRDDSAKHIGHAGAALGGHFHLTVVCAAFEGQSALSRHRLVYSALAEAMQNGIHALSITAWSPEEFACHVRST